MSRGRRRPGSCSSERRNARAGVVAPEAAAEHAGGARSRPCRISRSGLTIGCSIPIPTPLFDIPSHVVQTITVGRKCSDRSRAPVGCPFCVKRVISVRSQVVTIIGGVAVVVRQVLSRWCRPTETAARSALLAPPSPTPPPSAAGSLPPPCSYTPCRNPPFDTRS